MGFVVAFVVPCVSVLLLVPVLSRLAVPLGLVDEPGGRKHHRNTVPLIGGLVIFCVFLCLSLSGVFTARLDWTFYVGLLLLLGIGLVDDMAEANAWARFFVHVLVAGLVVIFGELRLDHLGNIFGLGTFDLGVMAIPFSMAAVVLLMNAMNLIDGLDGLCGGMSFLILGFLMTAFVLSGASGQAVQVLIVLGALAGFLFYNIRHPFRARASVFLGDAGSLSLGFVIAWFAISAANTAGSVLAPISVAWILAVPIVDICAQFFRRVMEGRHPFSPDRGHFHHHFIEAGFSPGQATSAILVLAFIFAGFGFFARSMGGWQVVLTLCWIFLLFSHMVLSRYPQTYITLFRSLKGRLVFK